MGRRLPAVLLVVALVLAGTGAGVAVVRSVAADGPPSDPRHAAVTALARRPGDVAGSARYLVRYAIESPGLRRELGTFEGTADFRRQRFLARSRFMKEGGPPEEGEVFVFAQWQYERSADDPKWGRRFLQPQNIGTPTPELAIVGLRGDRLAAPSYAVDPGVRRQIVDALLGEVVLHGREDQRGAPTWHYRVTVEPERAATRLPEPVRQEMRGWEEGQKRRQLDLWLDARGRLRKLSIFYPDKEGRGFRIDNEFWDFGGPGRIDLPADLGDPSAVGGEGVTSFTAPGVELDLDSPGFTMSVFTPDRPGDVVTLSVGDRPSYEAEARRRFFRITPAAGRHLEPGDYRVGTVGEVNDRVPFTADIGAPEVDAACPRRQPRTGTLTVVEAVQYEGRYHVRLHIRFTVSCRPSGGAAPMSVSGEARYYALT
jgi:hypothetical protein